MLLQHAGAISGFFGKVVPVVICWFRKTRERGPTIAPPLAARSPAERVDGLDTDHAIDARIARIINEIPQRRLRRHA